MSALDLRRWGVTMTDERARFVRYLRVELGCSWRAVARECATKWGGDWGENQLAGIAICRGAASQLGERGQTAPWN
jgi:hypothetical protein